jgi:hypothetical protein
VKEIKTHVTMIDTLVNFAKGNLSVEICDRDDNSATRWITKDRTITWEILHGWMKENLELKNEAQVYKPGIDRILSYQNYYIVTICRVDLILID